MVDKDTRKKLFLEKYRPTDDEILDEIYQFALGTKISPRAAINIFSCTGRAKAVTIAPCLAFCLEAFLRRKQKAIRGLSLE